MPATKKSTASKKSAATNPWIKHVAAFRKAHPSMDNKKVFKAAKATYKPKK